MNREKIIKMRIRKGKNMDRNQKDKLYNEDEKVSREDLRGGYYRSMRGHRVRAGGNPFVGQSQLAYQAHPSRIHNHRRRVHHSRYDYELLHRQGLSYRAHKHQFEKQISLHRGYKTKRHHADNSFKQEQKRLQHLIHLLRRRLEGVSYQLQQRQRGRRLHRIEGQNS